MLDGLAGQELGTPPSSDHAEGTAMDRRPPRPHQTAEDTLVNPGDPADHSHDRVLSYLHGVALANQPDDEPDSPVMVPVAFAARRGKATQA
jgi:hypothetical protein